MRRLDIKQKAVSQYLTRVLHNTVNKALIKLAGVSTVSTHWPDSQHQ